MHCMLTPSKIYAVKTGHPQKTGKTGPNRTPKADADSGTACKYTKNFI